MDRADHLHDEDPAKQAWKNAEFKGATVRHGNAISDCFAHQIRLLRHLLSLRHAHYLPVQALLHAELLHAEAPPLPQGRGESEVLAEQHLLKGEY
jgi:hypothetical protein